MSYLYLLLLANSAITQSSAFCTPNSSPSNVQEKDRFSHRHGVAHLQPAFSRNRKHSTVLLEQPFKMRMPWDPPEPPQQERQTSQAKKDVERKSSRQRRPRQPRNSYDLYGATPVLEEVDRHVHSAIDAAGGIREEDSTSSNDQSKQTKLGIILIDHGSKKQSSNDALHSIAERYETMLHQRLSASPEVSIAVRASHMELASPSIESALRSIIQEDRATKVICVPYFLSRGRHIAIDVPNLIEVAKDVLNEEGLLMDVQIEMSKHLGSDVDSMIETIDDLVKDLIKNEPAFSWMLANAASNHGAPDTKCNDDLQDQVRKYSNRSKLLEDMLEKEVQKLKIMSNRVTILEDVLNKKLEENDKLRSRLRAAAAVAGAKHPKQETKNSDHDYLANLTSTIDFLTKERTRIMAQVEDMENAFNATKSELIDKISLLENELKTQTETNANLQADIAASKNNPQLELDNKTLEAQQQTINDLQSQLAELLDAYNELEQLQNETEDAAASYTNQLKEIKRENEQLVQDQSEKLEEAHQKLEDSQRQFEQQKLKSQKLLEESCKEYEELLAQEKGEVTDWKNKYNQLLDEQNTQKDQNSAARARSEEEWSRLETKLQDALNASANSTSKIKELEKQLEQEKDKEPTDSLQNQLKQQQQLQEYLKGQIETYYETIQEQSKELDDYKQNINDMQKKHDESILIATASVEASQRRETDLLNSIEELEGELEEIQKEKTAIDKRLIELEEQLSTTSMQTNNADDQNKKLLVEIESLRRQIDTVSQEKEHILGEKVRLEYLIIDRALGEDRVSKELLGRVKPKKSILRYLLRPWLLFKRK
jgi:peptidoglycan hydrolase CwlO-like protein